MGETYEVFIDDVTIEVIIPTIMKILLLDQLSDVDVSEIRGFRQRCRESALSGTRSSGDENVWSAPCRHFLALS